MSGRDLVQDIVDFPQQREKETQFHEQALIFVLWRIQVERVATTLWNCLDFRLWGPPQLFSPVPYT